MKAPTSDELELTIFGPGYGESLLVHLGDSSWVVVDSCQKSGAQEPAAIEYLREIGIDPTESIKLIVISHWHDDHIRGVSNLCDQAPGAAVCIPAAFDKTEFRRFLAAHTDSVASSHGTGVDEIIGVVSRMRERAQNHLGLADTRLLHFNAGELSHGAKVEVWALSPSSFHTMESMGHFATLIPTLGETKRRAVPTKANNNSIALWIQCGEDSMLLGADLEQTVDDRAGWTAVASSRNRPNGTASIFKVPHHGSKTAHNDAVWEVMIAKGNIILDVPTQNP